MPLGENDYLRLVSAYPGNDIVADLPAELVPLWCDDYGAANPFAELVEVSVAETGAPAFSYLFDIAAQRNVVAWGVPGYVPRKREGYRQDKSPLGASRSYQRGHLMSHTTGGGLDINLVPQLGSMNKGAFSRLEIMIRKLAQAHRTCLYFVRTIYADDSQMPRQIEQCVIQPSRAVSYALHNNV